jgi:hypothetical protein
MGVKFEALKMMFEMQKHYIYIKKLLLFVLQPYISPLHFHKPYLAHLKTNSNDFCEIKCIKKGGYKTLSLFKGHTIVWKEL